MADRAHCWQVYKGTDLVLEVSDTPGPLVSTAAPPPGGKLVSHPFLSATSRSPMHEDHLRQILDASKDVEDFLRRLRAEGYMVKPR